MATIADFYKNIKKGTGGRGMRKIIITAVLASLVGSSFIGTDALAATSEKTIVNQKINAGTRDVTITPTTTFNDITLNGEVQTTNADPGVLTFTDASGTGEGYRVTATATQFKTIAPSAGFASGTSAKTLPKGSLLLKNDNAKITTIGGSTSKAPDWNGSSWVLDAGSEITVLKASIDNGMGKYEIDFDTKNYELTLNPSTTYIDKVNYATQATPYQSDITYTIVTGP